jgi:hypothetical protein
MSDFHSKIWEVHKDWCYGNPVILYGLIRSMKPKTVVEIGTYRGFSASWMAQGLKENGAGHLYCIDNFSLTDHESRHGDARRHLETNLNVVGVRDFITLIDGDSEKVTWPDRVDFAYVDGWHSYLAVKHDFEQCAKRGAECICLDDVTQSVGPRMLMDEPSIREEWDVTFVNRDCGMAICMRNVKRGPITFSQEIPGHVGHDLQTLTRVEQLAHLHTAALVNGVDYSHVTHLLHEGK